MDLRAEDIRVTFRDRAGRRRVAFEISELEFPQGSHTCVVGDSGCGKTTLLNVLSGVVLPDRGRVLLGDNDLTALREDQRDIFRAGHFGYVFQTFQLLPALSAIDNVALAVTAAQGGSLKRARKRAAEVLTRLGLAGRGDDLPQTLSVGECQRVALARAVSVRPAVLLADEPTASLDRPTGDAALALLRELAKETGCSLIVVTHDPTVQASFERVVSFSELSA